MTININTFHGSKFKVNFSNLPTLSKMIDIGQYDYFVKSVNIPDISLDLSNSDFRAGTIYHPVSRGNAGLPGISITFKCNEDLSNYYNLFDWMLQLRYGQNLNVESFRDNVIKMISIEFLDNQKITKSRINFSNCFLTSLSSLNLNMGQEDEVSFQSGFQYEEINYLNNL